MARFLVLIAGHFWLLFPLARSVRLVYWLNIKLIDINGQVSDKFPDGKHLCR
jgi:hypothetical protein